MPSETGNAPTEPSETRRDRRSHRAETSVAQSIPRPVRYALGAAVLTVALVGSLSFANAASTAQDAGRDAVADLSDVTGRDDVWAQVSRSEDERAPLDLLNEEAVSFTVAVDGETVALTTATTTTLADALIDAGIVVDLDDVVSAPMGEGVTEGEEITVTRVGTQIETDVKNLKFDTIEQETSSLPAGTTEVKTEGVTGSRVVTYEVEYSDGEPVDRTELSSIVAAQPVDEVVLVGTAPRRRPRPAPAARATAAPPSPPRRPPATPAATPARSRRAC